MASPLFSAGLPAFGEGLGALGPAWLQGLQVAKQLALLDAQLKQHQQPQVVAIQPGVAVVQEPRTGALRWEAAPTPVQDFLREMHTRQASAAARPTEALLLLQLYKENPSLAQEFFAMLHPERTGTAAWHEARAQQVQALTPGKVAEQAEKVKERAQEVLTKQKRQEVLQARKGQLGQVLANLKTQESILQHRAEAAQKEVSKLNEEIELAKARVAKVRSGTPADVTQAQQDLNRLLDEKVRHEQALAAAATALQQLRQEQAKLKQAETTTEEALRQPRVEATQALGEERREAVMHQRAATAREYAEVNLKRAQQDLTRERIKAQQALIALTDDRRLTEQERRQQLETVMRPLREAQIQALKALAEWRKAQAAQPTATRPAGKAGEPTVEETVERGPTGTKVRTKAKKTVTEAAEDLKRRQAAKALIQAVKDETPKRWGVFADQAAIQAALSEHLEALLTTDPETALIF